MINFLLTSHHWLGESTQIRFFKSKNAKDTTKEGGLWMYLEKNVGTPIQPLQHGINHQSSMGTTHPGGPLALYQTLEALRGVG